jgi:branched-chain amino acid transport system substrate-binding protein
MSKGKKRVALALLLAIAVVALAIALTACGGDSTSDSTASSSAAAGGGEVVWGELNSLTGVSAAPAKTLQQGYDFEIEQINASGGINGATIKSINLDDKSDMSASVAGVTQLINQDKVSTVIGPFPQMVATAARSISEKAGVPHMLYAPPTIADLEKTDYQWSFLCCTGPDGVADALLVAAKDQGYKNVVAIADVLPIHQESLVIMKQYASDAGITKLTVLPDKWDLSATDVSPIVAKIAAAAKAEKPDALFILSNPIHVPAIQKGLKALNIDIPVVGSAAGTSPAIFMQGPEAVEGFMALGTGITNPAELPADYPGKDITVQFAADFQAKYDAPPDFYAGFAFDAVNLVAQAQKAVDDPNDHAAVRDAIQNIKGWAGTQGVFTYSATDHVGIHGGFCLWQVVKGQWKLVQPLNPEGLVIVQPMAQ